MQNTMVGAGGGYGEWPLGKKELSEKSEKGEEKLMKIT